MEPEHERDEEVRDLLPFLGLIFVAAAALLAIGFGIGFIVGRYYACPQPVPAIALDRQGEDRFSGKTGQDHADDASLEECGTAGP